MLGYTLPPLRGLVLSSSKVFSIPLGAVLSDDFWMRDAGCRGDMPSPDTPEVFLPLGTQLTIAGIVVGLAGALALTRLMASLLHGVRPSDPMTLLMVSAVVAVAATIATCIPSLRATFVNPIVALRSE